MLRLRRWVRDPRIEIMLSILTPFLAYWPPEQLGGSGVLATVTAGLYISWNGLRLISAATRLQGIFFWDFLIYLIEGMVFLITGLQARALIAGIGNYSMSELAISAAIVSAVVIVARFVWMYPATYLPRWLIPAVAAQGSVAALAMARSRWRSPAFAASSRSPRRWRFRSPPRAVQPFPDRDLILFLTFSVILVTLVGQGLLLPAVIRWLGLANAGRRERRADRAEEFAARRQAIEAAIERLDQLAAERKLPEDIVAAAPHASPRPA